MLKHNYQVTSIEYSPNGLQLACGTSTGHIFLYDLRKHSPIFIKDHRYSLPIKSLQFHIDHSNKTRLLSLDAKIIKIWDINHATADIFTNIESNAPFNDFYAINNSGLLMATGEQHRIQTYYIPSLGPAPKWISYLDSLTEELEETRITANAYDDYKFITKEQLEYYGVSDLIGTNLLKAYMHGFYIDQRLYQKIKRRNWYRY